VLAVCRIVTQAIDARALESYVRDDSCGGIVTFLGVVREKANDGRGVTGLSYEAHQPMALAEFGAIAAEIDEQYPGVRLGIVHRIGDLAIGEIAVAVCAASPHRAHAFRACEYAIDQLKARAQIWKKEHYTDGTGEWISNQC
jgi:molybdopterin synthase catalytic subunit